MPDRGGVLISAHRCGFSEGAGFDNSPAGVRHAAEVGADYVEFDVRRCADGVFVCRHDATVALSDGNRTRVEELTSRELVAVQPGVALLADLVTAVADAALGAHVDFKFVTPDEVRHADRAWEVDAAEVCVGLLEAGRIAFTTNSESGVRALRDWADEHGHHALIGLTVGQSTAHLGLRAAVRARYREVFPGSRFRQSGATLLVAHQALARIRLIRWAARHQIPVLVWTIDGPRLTRRMLRDRRVWMITTNWPARAAKARPQ